MKRLPGSSVTSTMRIGVGLRRGDVNQLLSPATTLIFAPSMLAVGMAEASTVMAAGAMFRCPLARSIQIWKPFATSPTRSGCSSCTAPLPATVMWMAPGSMRLRVPIESWLMKPIGLSGRM